MQIGYNSADELASIRGLLRGLVYGPDLLRYWVWDAKLCEWVQLRFDGMLTKFRTRVAHPTKHYKDPKSVEMGA